MESPLLTTKVAPMLVALGQFVKQSRTSLGLSQEQLGLRVGLHRTYISDVERGSRNLTLGATTLLAEGLGISLSELIQRIDSADQSTSTGRSTSLELAS